MKKSIQNTLWFPLLLLIALAFCGCSNEPEEQKPSDIWDIDKDGIPSFVSTNYIELEKISQISKFRSSVGHDYSDAFEDCRSMKHYFQPRGDVDWTTIKIYSPITGTIIRWEPEWAGVKIEIQSDDYPAFRLVIFHVNPISQHNVGDKLTAGEQLGTHIGFETMSDISVIVNDPTRQGRMVSYFNVITNEVFNQYIARGITNRESMIISKELRDANPLQCSGDIFISDDPLECWVVLD